MSLFQLGDFTLHSGERSRWKIECDDLADREIRALAAMLAERLPSFSAAVGVPRGGLRIASAMAAHTTRFGQVLIVDDVLTTGASMERMRAPYRASDVIGAVIFARGPCPDWITPLFSMRGAK